MFFWNSLAFSVVQRMSTIWSLLYERQNILGIKILVSVAVWEPLILAVLSHFSCVWLFATPWTVARRAPLSMEFSRQEYWSGLPSQSAGVLPDAGIELVSPLSPASAGGFFTTSATWEAPCSWLSAGKCWNVMTNKMRVPALCWFTVCSGRQIGTRQLLRCVSTTVTGAQMQLWAAAACPSPGPVFCLYVVCFWDKGKRVCLPFCYDICFLCSWHSWSTDNLKIKFWDRTVRGPAGKSGLL